MTRGRKKKDVLPYFGEIQEWAVVQYNFSGATGEYKNELYEKYLKAAFEKMCESIINTYKLHSDDMSFDELMVDTISFLLTKMDKFNPSENKKAYSYYGTIIKNRLIGNRMKEKSDRDRVDSYEDYYTVLIEDERYSYTIADDTPNYTQEFFYEFPSILESAIKSNEKTAFLKKSEEKIANALLEILRDWDDNYCKDIDDGGVKYNKSIVSESLREMTGFNSKEVRDTMKKIKNLYFEQKQQSINKKERD